MSTARYDPLIGGANDRAAHKNSAQKKKIARIAIIALVLLVVAGAITAGILLSRRPKSLQQTLDEANFVDERKELVMPPLPEICGDVPEEQCQVIACEDCRLETVVSRECESLDPEPINCVAVHQYSLTFKAGQEPEGHSYTDKDPVPVSAELSTITHAQLHKTDDVDIVGVLVNGVIRIGDIRQSWNSLMEDFHYQLIMLPQNEGETINGRTQHTFSNRLVLIAHVEMPGYPSPCTNNQMGIDHWNNDIEPWYVRVWHNKVGFITNNHNSGGFDIFKVTLSTVEGCSVYISSKVDPILLSQYGVDHTIYHIKNYIIPTCSGGQGTVGPANMTPKLGLRVATRGCDSTAYPDIWLHEGCHNFGLQHASGYGGLCPNGVDITWKEYNGHPLILGFANNKMNRAPGASALVFAGIWHTGAITSVCPDYITSEVHTVHGTWEVDTETNPFKKYVTFWEGGHYYTVAFRSHTNSVPDGDIWNAATTTWKNYYGPEFVNRVHIMAQDYFTKDNNNCDSVLFHDSAGHTRQVAVLNTGESHTLGSVTITVDSMTATTATFTMSTPGLVTNINWSQTAGPANNGEEIYGKLYNVDSGGGNSAANGYDLDIASNSMVIVRFPGVNLPPGAVINSAHIKWVAAAAHSGTFTTTIAVEDEVDPAELVLLAPLGASSRNWLANPLTWTVTNSWTMNQSYNTINIKTLVQHVVNKPGWSCGNPISFLFDESSTGTRTAHSYTGGSSKYANEACAPDCLPELIITATATGTTQSTTTTTTTAPTTTTTTAPTTTTTTTTTSPSTAQNNSPSTTTTTTTAPTTTTTTTTQSTTAAGGLALMQFPATGSSLASESVAGTVSTTSASVTISSAGDIAMRFQNIGIAQGTKVHSAYLELTASATSDNVPLHVTISVESKTNPSTFSQTTKNISTRRFTEGKEWAEAEKFVAGSKYYSIDFAELVQSVVDQANFNNFSDLVVVCRATTTNEGSRQLNAAKLFLLA